MNNLLTTLYIVFTLLVLVQASGVLRVDTIFSSGDERIVVDNLLADHAEITTLQTHQIGFGTFDSLSVSAPGLDLSGSFLSIQQHDDLLFESTEGNITLGAAHSFEVDANLVTLLANDVLIDTPGAVEFTAQNAVLVNGNGININTGNGGVNFQATAGSLEITSVGSMTFDNYNLVLDTPGDIFTATDFDSLYVADQEIVAFSDNKFFIQNSGDQSFVSSTDSVTFNGDVNTVATGSLTANGFDTANVESINNEIRVFGYNGVIFNADGITVQGETDGVDIQVSNDEDFELTSGIYVTATNGDINLLTTSASDNSEIKLETTGFALGLEEDLNINSLGETRIDGQYIFGIETNSFTANIDRDGWVHASDQLTYTAGSSFGINANTIYLKATDPGLATNNDSQGKIEITAGNIIHGVSGISRNLYVSSNDLLIQSGTGGINFNARDTEFVADFTDARDQVAYLTAKDLDVSKNTADFDMIGGEIYLKGNTALYTIGKNWSLKAVHEENSEIEFTAPVSDWTVRRWTHTTGDGFFVPPSVSTSTQEIINFQSIDYITGPYYSITGLVADLEITSVDRFDFVAPRDITLISAGVTSFTSQSSSVTSSSLALNANADDLSLDATNSIIWTGQNAMVTTHRDEDSTDSLSYLMTGTVDIGPGQFHFHSLFHTQMNSNGFLVDASNIELSSGDFSDAIFTASDFDFQITSQLTIGGNSLSWEAGSAISVTGSNSIQFLTYANGLDGFAGANLEVYPTSSLNINVFNEVRLLADENLSFTTQNFGSTSTDDLWIHSDEGSVSFTVQALNSGLNVFANNITFATGDHPGDTFKIQAINSFWTSSETSFIDVSHGPLTFLSGSSVVNTGNFDVYAEGDVTFTTGQLSYSFDNGRGNFYGGSVDINAPGAALSIISDNLLTMNSTDTSVAGEVFDGFVDGFSYSSGGNMIFQNDAGGNMVFFSKDSMGISTLGAGGNIAFTGQNVDMASYLENQDIFWHAQTTLSLTVAADTSLTSLGDFWINTKSASKFEQGDVFVQIYDDFQISSEKAQFLVTDYGNQVLFQARALDQLAEDNYAVINSTKLGAFDAGNGISFTSFGASPSRREKDGISNSEFQFDSDVGFSVRTYAELGDIVVDCLQNEISLHSQETSIFKSAAWLFIDTLYQQTYNSGIHTTFAEDGLVWYRGATGIKVDAGQNLNFMSSQYGNLYADQSVEVETDDDFDIVSYHSNFYLKTYDRHDVLISTGRDISLTSAMGIDVIANGDLLWTTGLEWNVQADRGYSVTTSEEGISYTSTSAANTPNVVGASEELGILAGGDLVMGNQGVGGENMRFTGSQGVVFSTRAGNINVNTDTTTILGSTVEFNSIGSSSTNRDRVLFHAETSVTTSVSGRSFYDATELISIGQDNNRAQVQISGTGTEDAPGIIYNIAGNFEIDSDAQFQVQSGSAFNISTIASTQLTAATVSTITSSFGSIDVRADTGVISLRAGTDILETADTLVSTRSGELNLYYTGTANFVASQDFGVKSAYFNTIVDGNYQGTIADLITYQTTRPDGTMNWEIAQTLTTSADSGISFKADQFLDYTFGDFAATATQNTVVEISNDVPGHILYNTNDFTFTVTDVSDITGRRLDFLVPSLTGTISVQSDGETLLESFFDTEFSTNNDATYTATTTADFAAVDSFRVLAKGSVSVVAADTMEFDTLTNHVSTQPFSGGSILFTGTTFIHQGNPSVVTLQAGGGLFIQTTPKQVDLTATSFDVSFSTTNRDADIVINSGAAGGAAGSITFDATLSVFSQSGDSSSTGNTLFTAPDIVVSNAATLDFFTGAADVATDSPINIRGVNSLATIGLLNVIADSPVTQEGQGTIQIVSPTLAFDGLGGDIYFAANESRITTEVRDATRWNAGTGAGLILFNTNGVNGGVRFDSDSFDFASITNTLNVAAGRQTLVSASSDNFAKVSYTYDNIFTTAGATAGIADSNIQFSTQNEDSSITLNLDALTTNTDNLQITTQVSSEFSAPDFLIAALNDIDFVSEGVKINTATSAISGFVVGSTGLLQLGTAASNIDFYAQDTLGVAVAGAGSVTTTNTHIESISDITFAAQTFGATSAIFTALSEGITVAPPTGGIDMEFGVDARFVGGLYEDESKIFVSTSAFGASTTTGIDFSALGDLYLEADSNIQMKSKRSFRADFTDDINMLALKGDILFRSISLDTDQIRNGPFDLIMQSNNDEPGITFDTFYRFAHRQHLRLAMFDPESCPGRAAAPNEDCCSAQQQPTTVFDWRVLDGFGNLLEPYLQACNCSFGDCGNVQCPDTTERVAQLQEALIEMGLLYAR